MAPLRPLHLQHVTRITVLDGVVGRSSMRRVDGLSTYVPAPTQGSASTSSDLHLLGTIGSTVYDVDLDRDSFFTVAVDDACNAYLSVTVDGRWAACGTETGTEVFTVGAPQPAHQGLLLENEGVQVRYESISWGPGGHFLAAVAFRGDNTRSVAIYRVSATRDAGQLTATMTFPDLVVDQVSWSPDGKWPAFIASPNGGILSSRLLYVGSLLSELAPPEGTPIATPPTIAVTASMLEDLQGGDVAWGPQAGAITFAGSSGKIIERNLAKGSERTILTQNSENLCGLAWAPDGHRLIFQICGPSGGDYAGTPAQLYVYDATGAS